jgi:hypothetical protein
MDIGWIVNFLAAKESDLIDQAKELLQTLNEYRKKIKPGSSDTDVKIKNFGFNVGKSDRDYTLNAEVDFSLTPKKESKNSKQEE